MNRFSLATAACLLICSMATASTDTHPEGWNLVWEENFDGNEIDTSVWNKCSRRSSEWCNTMSDDPSLFEVRDGILYLRGVVNPDTVADPSPYLTGGIETRLHKSFDPGRIEVRARLHGAKGAWPAIWMLPSHNGNWPSTGEIDILERLNFDDFVYQTVHSYYTFRLGNKTEPQSSLRTPADMSEFNTYGVEIHPDKIVFLINGEEAGVYPKINDGADGQFPFYRPMYLMIDMQLGGKWVGEVDPADLPVEMEVDWVRYYLPDTDN